MGIRVHFSKSEIEEYFCKLPSEKEREYEKKLASLAEKCSDNDNMQILMELVDDSSLYSYEAIQCLLIIHRRNKDFERMKCLFERYPQFKKRISYNHLRIQYMVHSESFYDFNDLLVLAYRDAQIFENNAGYHQTFANAFVTICENCSDEDRTQIVRQWYEDAFCSINKAIALDGGYAKFYCTKGRILCQKGEYAEALSLVNYAISIENSSRPDYALTIMTYQMYKLNIQREQEKKELYSRITSIESVLQKIITQQNMDVHGMFSEGNAVEENYHEIHAYTGCEPYAFISYAHQDQNEVYKIIGNLQRKNARIWFDKGLELGKEWPEEIANHLIKSALVLVMLSANSIQSANVRREVNLALSEEKEIIVIKLDDVDLSPGMKLQFGLYQMIMKKQYEADSFIEVLSKAVNDRLES